MEEVLPPSTMDGAGFEPTRVTQFTVFLENRVGRLAGLVTLFEEHVGVINGISIEESADSSLVRIICSNPDEARIALKNEEFSFSENDVLLVELPKRTKHPLLALCTAVLAAEINIRYAYPLLVRPKGPALALFADDPTLVAQLLIKKGFTILGESDLKN
jgi:hypothetical protein